MLSIKARIAALAARLQEDRQDTPYEELDPISKSIVDLIHELEALDTQEKKAVYCERYGLGVDGLDAFIHDLTVDY